MCENSAMAGRITGFSSFTKGKAAGVLPEKGIIVHYFSKGGLPGKKEQLTIQNYGSTFTAEELCLNIAHTLNIAPLTFHLFSLATLDLSVWLAPNAKIECSETGGVEYVFRIRVAPPKIEQIVGVDQEAFGYFYLQCRSDFVSESFMYKESVKQERQLGQGLIDMLCYGREGNLGLDQLNKLKPKLFIPANTKNMFKKVWEKQRLEVNMKAQLNVEHEKSERDSINDIKLRYMKGFLEITERYLVEHFEISADGDSVHTIIVDIYRDEQPGIYLAHNARLQGKVDIQEEMSYVCAIEDLYGINVFVDSLSVLMMSEARTQRLKFRDRAILESFVSLLSTCYRLMKKFHEPLCDSYTSPMMDNLKRVKCHGPVQKDWAVNHLQKRHQQNKMYNYLLKQKSADLGSYVLIHLQPDLSTMIINISRQQSGKLQLSCGTEEPLFADIASLLRHYTGSGHPRIQLRMCVPPQPPDDPYLLLCRHALMQSNTTKEQQPQSSVVKLVSYVNTQHSVKAIGHGHFTSVWKGKLEELAKVGEVAIKQLNRSNSSISLQHFQSAIQTASFWSHAAIVKVHAVSLAPHFQAMLEYTPLGSLETYLRQPHRGLIVRDLVHVAEDIAQALYYLEGKVSVTGCGEVHGNIRCRNVLVWSHQPGSRLVVKLTDPGLVHFYNSLPLHDDINYERFAWIAPECYNNLKDITKYSDRYAFGTTMWELFSSGDRPHGHKPSKQIEEFVLEGNQLQAPALCPSDIIELMHGCWNLQPEERPTAQVILRNIIRISQSVADERYYSILTWGNTETNSASNYDKLLMQPVVPPSESSVLGLPLPTSPSSSAGLTSVGAASDAWGWSGSCDSRTPLIPTTRQISDAAPRSQQRPLPDLPPDSHQVLQSEQLHMHKDKQLGKGHYGVVYKGDLRVSGDTCSVAVKSLHAKMYHRYVEEFEKEIKMMQKLCHENIVKVIGYLPQRDSENPMLLVMEYVAKGCLSHYLHHLSKKKDNIPQNTLLTFGEEIAEGMKYLHSKEIIHRDLAARNILVTANVHMKISDFGLARILSPERDYYRSDATKEIPAAWCAPEALLQRLFSRESDVWSYGITLWEVYSFGATPSLCKFDDILCFLHEGERLKKPVGCPQDVYQLMYKCWEYYPKNRIHFDNILNAIVGLKSNLPI